MTPRAVISLFLVAGVAGATASSAQSQRFLAEQNRLHQEAVAARKARGLTLEDAMKKFPAASLQKVKIQKVAPGASAAISLAGTLPAGAAVFSDRDGATVSGMTLTATNMSARMTVGAGEGPGFVKLSVITPISFEMVRVPVVFIDTVYRFELKAPDGLTVKLFPTETTFTITDDRNASLKYQADFFKPGEATPFETRIGDMAFRFGEEPRARLDITLLERPSPAHAELEEIGKKLEDPRVTSAQRAALMQRMMKAQQAQMNELMKSMKADPAVEQKKVDDFGCRLAQIYPGADGTGKATVLCGKNFYKGAMQTTATIAPGR